MKECNLYKGIVWLAVFGILASAAVRQIKIYQKEQKVYGFGLYAEQDLTEDVREEFRKLAGILSFEPTDTVSVTLQLETYTLETDLTGIDLLEYPLKWQKVSSEVTMGNTPALFLSEEIFSSFTDKSGYSPRKSQIEKWVQQYETLELKIMDEDGTERKAKICGILKKPGNKVCMDKDQMEEIFRGNTHTTGGFMEIYGYTNMKKACRLLEDAGFLCSLDE